MTFTFKKTSSISPPGGSIALLTVTGLMCAVLLSLAYSLAFPLTAKAQVRCGGSCYPDVTACQVARCGSTSCAECDTGCAPDPECVVSGGEETPAPAPGPAPTGPRRTTLENPLGRTTDIKVLVGRAINGFMALSGSFALLMFVYGGFTWVTSAGNMDKVKRGKQVFVWASIGLIIVFGSYAFLNTFINALGGS